MATEFGRYGIWRQWQLMTPELVAELERLGFGTVWVGSSPDGDLALVEQYLEATTRITIATSVVNMWKDEPATVAASYHRITEKYPDRFLLGLGIGHREATREYASPFRRMVDYLDALDGAGVPEDGRALAALGPRALGLAATRTAGALPYLVTPQHTQRARHIVGAERLLAPEHKVVLEERTERAREIARQRLHGYLQMANYRSSLRRLGFTDEDLAGGGSDRLVDELAFHGTPDHVAGRLREHFDAGADHVVVQLLTEPDADPLRGYRALADVLLG